MDQIKHKNKDFFPFLLSWRTQSNSFSFNRKKFMELFTNWTANTTPTCYRKMHKISSDSPILLFIVLGHTVRSNSREEFTVPWICWRQNFQIWDISWLNKGKKGVACSNRLWMISLIFQPPMMFSIRAWFGEVKRIWTRRCAYILVATRVPD